MRNVPIDEVFTWQEDFGLKAKEAFGNHACDASPATMSVIRERCDKIERDNEAYRFWPMPAPLNGVVIHEVEGIPDGVVAPCSCTPSGVRSEQKGEAVK